MSYMDRKIIKIKGGVTAARGFQASGMHCGIKKKKDDLTLIYSVVPAVGAAVFTTNKVQAVPVKISKKHIKAKEHQAIIVNSGNANCFAGKEGVENALKMVSSLAGELKISPEKVLVASTGIIGRPLPVKKILDSIPQLVKTLGAGANAGKRAARAILTTDTRIKETAVSLNIGGKKVTIGGIAKGAGMIAPDMATLLAFITTDACIQKTALFRALKESVAKSFNLITVDGDMSTNDTVIVLANGLSGNRQITAGSRPVRNNPIRNELSNGARISNRSRDFELFVKGLNSVTVQLAKALVADAEGASKLIEVTVKGAKSGNEAKTAAFAVSNSLLVKTMIHGNDPNWGRIAAAVGASGAGFKEEKLSIYFGKSAAVKNGAPVSANRDRIKKEVRKKIVAILIDLGMGKAKATVRTSDLSEEYVRINAKYST